MFSTLSDTMLNRKTKQESKSNHNHVKKKNERRWHEETKSKREKDEQYRVMKTIWGCGFEKE
jgi:hypothetical protein